MPDTLPGWLMFAFYTLGALGGLGFIAMWAFVAIGELKVRRRQRQWQERQGRRM